MNQPKERMMGLHELVLSALEERLQGEPCLKDLELAMRFLKDNNVFIDLNAGNQREELKASMARIPRLTPDELKLG